VDRDSILIDQASGLHVGWYFWLRVLDEVNRSARYGNPFGLLILDVDVNGRRNGNEDELNEVAASIRSADVGGRLSPHRAGVMLLEQDVASAKAGTERIVMRLKSASGTDWRSNLYCYPSDGAAISNLLTQGRAELKRRDLPA
jgi:PleD family two-component response regulator